MRLTLATYEHTQHNDNQCLSFVPAVANVACVCDAVGDFLPWSSEICDELTRQLQFSHWAALHLPVNN
jgi:hypothetical protein